MKLIVGPVKTTLLIFLVLSVAACQSGKYDKTIKLAGGSTAAVSQDAETDEPLFNAFLYLNSFSKVDYSVRASQSIIAEKFYQGTGYTLKIEHHRISWFNMRGGSDFKDVESFNTFLRKSNRSNLVGHGKYIEDNSGYGFYADDGNCVAAMYAKRIKDHTRFDNDDGGPDM